MSVIEINYLDRIDGKKLFEVVPLNKRRAWMNNTSKAFAYHCMPLTIANEHAWGVPSPGYFEAEWNGGPDQEDMNIYFDADSFSFEWVSSHFGNGVLTINVDFILKTERGISTYVRGMPNYFKRGIQPLDAIIETDWLPYTFTYNYIFTQPGRVSFEKDEILFSFFPVRRTWIESFDLVEKNIQDNVEFYKKYKEYDAARAKRLQERDPEVDESKLSHLLEEKGFQKFYKNAEDPNGQSYRPFLHRKRIKLNRPIED